VYQEVPK